MTLVQCFRVTAQVCCLLALAACSSGSTPSRKHVDPNAGEGGQAGSEAASDPDDDEAIGGASAQAETNRKLGESHSGYRSALCFDCHGKVAAYPHAEQQYAPSNCASCHGNNGASRRDHAVPENPGCVECHNTVSHVPRFQAPKDCIACHGKV